MAKMTIAEAFDFPFRRIGQKNDGEPYYAVGTLRMEPLPAEAIEYEVAVPEMTFIGPVKPSFAEAVGAGIRPCQSYLDQPLNTDTRPRKPFPGKLDV